MRVEDAREQLAALLTERGVRLSDAPGGSLGGPGEQAREAWQAFRDAARTPVEGPSQIGEGSAIVLDDVDSDLLLFESAWAPARPAGGLGWAPEGSEPSVYKLMFTRQFTLSDQAGHTGMKALVLTVECAGEQDQVDARAQRWGYAGRPRPDVSDQSHPELARWAGHVEAWAEHVERSRSFAALNILQPVRFFIDHGDV